MAPIRMSSNRYAMTAHYRWTKLIRLCLRNRRIVLVVCLTLCFFAYVHLFFQSYSQLYVSFRAPSTLPISKIDGLWTRENMECIAWRKSKECEPLISKDAVNDKGCHDMIQANSSGYCEYRNRTSGELHNVILTQCGGMNVNITCDLGFQFHNFHLLSSNFHLWSPPIQQKYSLKASVSKRGIVMVMSHNRIISAYVSVRLLREYGCTLPIELWYHKDQVDTKNQHIIELTRDYQTTLRKPDTLESHIVDSSLKIYALYYSHFDQVLVLDADVIATEDPSYLFDLPEFTSNGAMFWPGYSIAGARDFNVYHNNIIGELLDIKLSLMFEQDGGQVLIDRKKCVECLRMLMFYASNMDLLRTLELVENEKDLYRLAWTKSKQSFYMVSQPPGSAGLSSAGKFCGLSLVQHDLYGKVLFINRNSVSFDMADGDWPWWTHLQEFVGSFDPAVHKVSTTASGQHAFGPHDCLGAYDPDPNYRNTPIESTSFANLEHKALTIVKKIRNVD